MAGRYDRMLDPRVVGPSEKSSRTEVLDLGPYSSVRAQIRVLKAGNAGTIYLQEAAVNEEDAFFTLSGTTVNLNATANSIMSLSGHLRYVRWCTDGAVAGSPVVLIDIVARE